MVNLATVLIPPFRFSTVEERLYRGGYPTLKNFRFLKRLQLRTIVSVIPEPPTSDLVGFCQSEQIALRHFPAEKYTSDNVTVSGQIVSEILTLLCAPPHQPLYVHCLDGANVVGIIIMILRKLQNWTKSAILLEFCRFTRDNTIEKEESEYFNEFAEEIVLPAELPFWLWHGVFYQKHPSIKLKYTKPLMDTIASTTADHPPLPINIPQTIEWDSLEKNVFDFEGDLDNDDEYDEEYYDSSLSTQLEALDLAGL